MLKKFWLVVFCVCCLCLSNHVKANNLSSSLNNKIFNNLQINRPYNLLKGILLMQFSFLDGGLRRGTCKQIYVHQFNKNRTKVNNTVLITLNNDSLIINSEKDTLILSDTIFQKLPKKVKFKRGKAIIFTILTGLLGGHRIYLGTHQRVPIIYAITLGGFGILPFIDLVNIIFTKDLSRFENNPKVIMWGK